MNVALPSCSECGGELVVASGNLLCGRCLLGSALSPGTSDTDATSRDLTVLLAKPTPARGVKFHYFGDYELLEEIARGGMGVVFRARQSSLNRVVALKMIVAGQLASKEAVRRFRAEAEAAARLDHPNIVPIYEVGEHDGLHYFTMKLVEGGSLADALQSRRFTPRDAARLMAAIARALSHAHERNILHRDLKPSNILLDRDGQPHITDFGLAKVVSAEHASQTAILGTPAYAAPEQALRGHSITASADVYSLGVILYEMLSGRLPFEANSPLEKVRQAKDELPARLRDCGIDADLEAICFKCLSPDAQSRYASAGAYADDLDRWSRGLPVRARRATPVSRARYWMKRRPALATVLMLSMILATAVPVLWREIRIAREEKNAFISSVRAEKIRELEALRKQWANLDVPFVSISSELRSEIWKARSSVVVPNNKSERYSVGIYAHERPIETAGQFAPLLGWLEDSLSLARSNRVRLDLRIYKHNRAARTALVHGAVDIVRLGAGPFLLAQEALALEGKTVEVLAKARPGTYTAVLFARSDAGITNVSGLRGRSLALGSLESTISGFHIPAVLVETGLTASDLRVQFYRSHNEAISEVLGGRFEAGAAKTHVFEKHRGRSPGLVALTNVSCISMPWVARSGLRPEIAALFRRSLLSLKDRKILDLLPDQPDEGFEPASAGEYEPMREHHRSAERFVSAADGNVADVSTPLGPKPSANPLP